MGMTMKFKMIVTREDGRWTKSLKAKAPSRLESLDIVAEKDFLAPAMDFQNLAARL